MEERFAPLDRLVDRQLCSRCSKKRLFFCYDCCIYMNGVEELVPTIELPIKIDIIKHFKEQNSKSTAIHCKLLAPNYTRLFGPNDSTIPDYLAEADQINSVLVYPDKQATSMLEYRQRSGRPIERLVFLDSTWQTINGLRALPQIQGLPTVSLNSYKTAFWRPQKGYPDECLATIEAIYYAVCEANQANQVATGQEDVKNNQKFEDLLFWFRFFKQKFIDGQT
ncbi:TRNA-uridine aminocarboxypropyltransferase [Aphelenchoides besseyi]|nr:TRNA-uridine aminocarboxypropyltransferase [Aphelenchoides besseyi]KAI6209929.1 TRNA-uridine aminocarboxypropyltransferase [Aphelenchoides besseyi]